MGAVKPLFPAPGPLVRAAVSVLVRAGAEREAALEFVIATARSAQRQLGHDGDGTGPMWMFQVEAAARSRLARLREQN
jgi:hypothetical protein